MRKRRTSGRRKTRGELEREKGKRRWKNKSAEATLLLRSPFISKSQPNVDTLVVLLFSHCSIGLSENDQEQSSSHRKLQLK